MSSCATPASTNPSLRDTLVHLNDQKGTLCNGSPERDLYSERRVARRNTLARPELLDPHAWVRLGTPVFLTGAYQRFRRPRNLRSGSGRGGPLGGLRGGDRLGPGAQCLVVDHRTPRRRPPGSRSGSTRRASARLNKTVTSAMARP